MLGEYKKISKKCLRCGEDMVMPEPQFGKEMKVYSTWFLITKSSEVDLLVCTCCGYTELHTRRPEILKNKKKK